MSTNQAEQWAAEAIEAAGKPKATLADQLVNVCKLHTQPMQGLYVDDRGTVRFKANSLVRYILDNGGIDMNHLARQTFPADDREQFAQLIGYSLSGFGELPYVSDATYDKAALIADRLNNDRVTGAL